MPGPGFQSESDFDAQDQAEMFDESMTVGGERESFLDEDFVRGLDENRPFEELADVFDVTQAAGDRDDDEALALDAADFDEEAFDTDGADDDNELDYGAVTGEHEDDLDGLGAEPGADGFDEDQLGASDIEGLDEVRDRNEVTGGEDDFTNFQARNVGDEDLKRMGYAEDREGQTVFKPDKR